MINLTRIQPDLFIGTCPQTHIDVDRLKAGPRITAVLNLQTDEDLVALGVNWTALEAYYAVCDLVIARWPIRDFDAEDLRRRLDGAVASLDQLLRGGHRVYVHCTAGVGRAPGVAIAYLSWVKGWDLDKAHGHVTSHRSCAPYLDAIRRAASEREAAATTKA